MYELGGGSRCWVRWGQLVLVGSMPLSVLSAVIRRCPMSLWRELMWFFGFGWSCCIEAGVIALQLGYRAWMNQPTSLCRGGGESMGSGVSRGAGWRGWRWWRKLGLRSSLPCHYSICGFIPIVPMYFAYHHGFVVSSLLGFARVSWCLTPALVLISHIGVCCWTSNSSGCRRTHLAVVEPVSIIESSLPLLNPSHCGCPCRCS